MADLVAAFVGHKPPPSARRKVPKKANNEALGELMSMFGLGARR